MHNEPDNIPDKQTSMTWWGEQHIEAGQHARWLVGPLELDILRLEKEWQICHKSHDEAGWDESQWHVRLNDSALETEECKRFVFKATEPQLSIQPRLPDRSMVIKPNTPLYISNQQQVTLYVGTPLWLKIAVHKNSVELDEFPTQRPSDTWFGPSTREGELCYASHTHGRLDLEGLPQRPHKAFTEITIENAANSPFLLERINLPVPNLSLFQNRDGQVWTNSVSMRREKDESSAALQFQSTPPTAAGQTTHLSDPRETIVSESLLRAFSSLFG